MTKMIQAAAIWGRHDVVHQLTMTSTRADRTRALTYAAQAGYVDICRTLLRAGADVEQEKTLRGAVAFGSPAVLGGTDERVDRLATIRLICATMIMRDMDLLVVHSDVRIYHAIQQLYRELARQWGTEYVRAYCAFQRWSTRWKAAPAAQNAIEWFAWDGHCRKNSWPRIPLEESHDIYFHMMSVNPIWMLDTLR